MKNSTCHITENGSGQLGIERERPLDLPGRLIFFFFCLKSSILIKYYCIKEHNLNNK